MERIPLPEHPDDINAEWLRKALAAGGTSNLSEMESVEVERLSDVANAMGNLLRCRGAAHGDVAADPVSVIVKLPTSSAIPLKLAK